MQLNRYYFTFGTDSAFPFRGGWVLVMAANRQSAERIFREYYPNRAYSERMNCSWVYSAEDFQKTDMCKQGNFGQFCHAVIGPHHPGDKKE